MKDAKRFNLCSHHHCVVCSKNRQDAGGILFPCQCCDRAYCEECLPKTGVSFLEKVDRFEKLGFDSTKNVVYINCKPDCEEYARTQFGYDSEQETKVICPKELNLSKYFGTLNDLNDDTEEDQAADEVESENDMIDSDRGLRTRTLTVKTIKQDQIEPKGKGGTTCARQVVKICPSTEKVVERYYSVSAAARSLGTYAQRLAHHMKSPEEHIFKDFYWRFQDDSDQTSDDENDDIESVPMAEETKKKAYRKKIMQICLETGRVVGRFESISAAAKFVGSNRWMLWSHMKKTPSHKFMGFNWRFQDDSDLTSDDEESDDDESSVVTVKTSRRGKKIIQICLDTARVVGRYESISAAARTIGSNRFNMCSHMKNTPSHQYMGFNWKIEEDSDQTSNNEKIGITYVPMVGEMAEETTKKPSTASKKIMKICLETARVVGRYESISAAAKSAGLNRCMLGSHMRKTPSHEFMGFNWRFQDDSDLTLDDENDVIASVPMAGKTTKQDARKIEKKIMKICVETAQVVGQYDTIFAAAKSVGTYGARLNNHMTNSPAHPFESFYWRFGNNLELTLDAEENDVDKSSVVLAEETRTKDTGDSEQYSTHGKKIMKICLETAQVVTQYGSVTTAAKSNGICRSKLSQHMKHFPAHPLDGFYWRFGKDTDLTLDAEENDSNSYVSLAEVEVKSPPVSISTASASSNNILPPSPSRKSPPPPNPTITRKPIIGQMSYPNTSSLTQRHKSKVDVHQPSYPTGMQQMLIGHHPITGQLPNMMRELGTQGGHSIQYGVRLPNRGRLEPVQLLQQQLDPIQQLQQHHINRDAFIMPDANPPVNQQITSYPHFQNFIGFLQPGPTQQLLQAPQPIHTSTRPFTLNSAVNYMDNASRGMPNSDFGCDADHAIELE